MKPCATSRGKRWRGSDQAPTLRLEGLERAYAQGPRTIEVLKGASASFFPGEAVALLGPSGAGKSTLLHIAGLLEQPDGGAVLIDGVDCVKLGDSRAHAHAPRGDRLRLSVPSSVAGVHGARECDPAAAHSWAYRGREADEPRERCLESLGLGERVEHRPAQLSGGEQQRVAIARAVANGPKLLLADEPTGNLDPPTAERVFEQLLSLVRQSGVAAVIATHNLDLAARMDRTLRLMDGILIEEEVAVVEVSAVIDCQPISK